MGQIPRQGSLHTATSVVAEPSPDIDETTRLAEQVADLAARVAQLTSDVAILTKRLETLVSFEEYRDVVLTRHSSQSYKLPSSSFLDVRDFMDCADGIYALEYTPAGEPFRWTGPGDRTRFSFFVDRSVEIRARVKIHSRGRLTDRDAVAVAIDGIVYRLSPAERADELVTGPVESRLGRSRTDMILHVPVMFTPDPPNEDRRRLGIAITGITLEPFE
jgi:hypothetical protein